MGSRFDLSVIEMNVDVFAAVRTSRLPVETLYLYLVPGTRTVHRYNSVYTCDMAVCLSTRVGREVYAYLYQVLPVLALLCVHCALEYLQYTSHTVLVLVH